MIRTKFSRRWDHLRLRANALAREAGQHGDKASSGSVESRSRTP